MTPRPPSFRASLDHLTHGLVDAVLGAIRSAVEAEIGTLTLAHPVVAVRAGASARTATSAAAHRAARAPSASAPSSPPHRAPASVDSFTTETFDPATIIVDPEAMLRRATEATTASPTEVDVARGEPTTTLDPEAVVGRARRTPGSRERAAETAPRRARADVSAWTARSDERDARADVPSFVVRPGEDILRAAGGAIVLRRRPLTAPAVSTDTETALSPPRAVQASSIPPE